MRRVLVDQHQPVLRLGHDIGIGDLPAGDAQRIVLRGFRHRGCFLGPSARFGHDVALGRTPGAAGFGDALLRRGPVTPLEDRAQRG